MAEQDQFDITNVLSVEDRLAAEALIVDVDTVKAHAESLGLFLFGFARDWGA